MKPLVFSESNRIDSVTHTNIFQLIYTSVYVDCLDKQCIEIQQALLLILTIVYFRLIFIFFKFSDPFYVNLWTITFSSIDGCF